MNARLLVLAVLAAVIAFANAKSYTASHNALIASKLKELARNQRELAQVLRRAPARGGGGMVKNIVSRASSSGRANVARQAMQKQAASRAQAVMRMNQARKMQMAKMQGAKMRVAKMASAARGAKGGKMGKAARGGKGGNRGGKKNTRSLKGGKKGGKQGGKKGGKNGKGKKGGKKGGEEGGEGEEGAQAEKEAGAGAGAEAGAEQPENPSEPNEAGAGPMGEAGEPNEAGAGPMGGPMGEPMGAAGEADAEGMPASPMRSATAGRFPMKPSFNQLPTGEDFGGNYGAAPSRRARNNGARPGINRIDRSLYGDRPVQRPQPPQQAPQQPSNDGPSDNYVINVHCGRSKKK